MRQRESSSLIPRRSELPQKLGRFFGRRGVDKKTGPPFKTGKFGKLGDDLKMPVVIFQVAFVERGGMEGEVVGGQVERFIQSFEGFREDLPGILTVSCM